MDGKIILTKEYSVSCAECGKVNVVMDVTRRQYEYILRNIGWVNTSNKGWVCYYCIDKE